MQSIPYGGWKRCARLVSGDVEAIVTLDVGPRVIRLGFVGEPNQLHEDPDEMGKTGGDEYRSYGGHRLWIAPEDKVRTYQPENSPVEYTEENGWHIFKPKPDQFGMQKELRIQPSGDGTFHLDHRISNNGQQSVEMAIWALTVMTTGGTCLVPQADPKPFPEILTPVRPLAIWSYLDMSDARLTWGKRLVRLRQDTAKGPIKFGMGVNQGYVGYSNGSNLFVKRFPFDEGHYPDYGCNFETFTRQDMLEVESLGFLGKLKPFETVNHPEAWGLFKGVKLPDDDEGCANALAEYAGRVAMA